jgi:hypothetical protein
MYRECFQILRSSVVLNYLCYFSPPLLWVIESSLQFELRERFIKIEMLVAREFCSSYLHLV